MIDSVVEMTVVTAAGGLKSCCLKTKYLHSLRVIRYTTQDNYIGLSNYTHKSAVILNLHHLYRHTGYHSQFTWLG